MRILFGKASRYHLSAVSVAAALIGVLVGFPILAATLSVGPGQTYATVSAAVAAANSNDIINVQAGTYINDFPEVNVPLTINGVGGVALLQATIAIPNRKGILLANASLTLNNLEFEGALVTDADGGNGAGVRYQGGNLTIENCIFLSNQDGILANPVDGAVILIDHSTFTNNGSGTGYTHAVYINAIASFTVQNSTFNGTKVGHDVKSRAAATVISDNYLDDGLTGTTSYAIDIPNGGNATIAGNQIVQGPATQNPAMIEYGAEGEIYTSQSLLVQNNIFTNSFSGQSVGVYNHTNDVSAQLAGNTFTNVVIPLIGPGGIVFSSLYSSILPEGRSVQLGAVATVFATILNAGAGEVTNCMIALRGGTPAGLSVDYQTTSSITNTLTGQADTPIGIPADGSQSFLLTFKSTTPVTLQALPLSYACDGATGPTVITGVNTIDLTFSTTPIPDLVALIATASGDGILTVPFSQGGAAAFAIASDNVGVSGTLNVTVDTGGVTLPLTTTICQTNPATAQCLSAPASSLVQIVAAGETATYSVFVKSTGPITFSPATARVFVRFTDQNGQGHGATSLAVMTN